MKLYTQLRSQKKIIYREMRYKRLVVETINYTIKLN